MSNVGFPQQPTNADEGAPLLGLYLDRPAWKVDPKGFSACNNVRIERGRVRSDLLGWALAATLPEPVVHISSFNTSFPWNGVTGGVQIAVTATDIYNISNLAAITYLTPAYKEGMATVTHNSTTVTGVNTRWNSDIQDGGAYDRCMPLATTIAGAQNINVNFGASYNWASPGVPVSCLTNPAAIAPGTLLFRFIAATATEQLQLVLSQALLEDVTTADVIQVGSSLALRKSLRAGDKIYFGSQTHNAVDAAWYTIASVNSDTSLTLTQAYAGSTATVYYIARQLLTDTTGGPNPYIPHCSSVTFNNAAGMWQGDSWFFTNGVDPVVQLWNEGYPSFSNAFNTAWFSFFARSIPFRCTTLTHAHSTLVCGNLYNGTGQIIPDPLSIANSDNGDPTNFAGGIAFQGDVADAAAEIVHMSSLGGVLLIYARGVWQGSADAMLSESGGLVVAAQFVGEPTIWNFSTILQNRGPIAGGLVVEQPDRHEFLGIDGQYRYNGLFVQVMNDQVWRQVLKGFDASRAQVAMSMVVPTYGDVLWGVPLLSDAVGVLGVTTAYAEHYMEQANSYLFKPMTQRDFPFTTLGVVVDTTSVTFDELPGFFETYPQSFDQFGSPRIQPPVYLAGDVGGNLWKLYTNNTQNGTPALCTATFGARTIGNARARALVKRVYPGFEVAPNGTANVTLTLYDALGGPVTVTDTEAFDLTYSGNRFTTHYRRGRLASVTLWDAAGVGWVSDGYDWDWVNGGVR